jgi:hypothetical protein
MPNKVIYWPKLFEGRIKAPHKPATLYGYGMGMHNSFTGRGYGCGWNNGTDGKGIGRGAYHQYTTARSNDYD